MPTLFDLTGRVALVTGGTAVSAARSCARSPPPGPTSWSRAASRRRARRPPQEVRGLGRVPSRTLPRRALGRDRALVDAAYEAFGRVDVLVNNAGIAPTYPDPQSVSEELWDKVLAVNLKGPFRLTALVGERMVAGGGGSIVNISLDRQRAPDARHPPLRGRKAGLNALTVGFADALGPRCA